MMYYGKRLLVKTEANRLTSTCTSLWGTHLKRTSGCIQIKYSLHFLFKNSEINFLTQSNNHYCVPKLKHALPCHTRTAKQSLSDDHIHTPFPHSRKTPHDSLPLTNYHRGPYLCNERARNLSHTGSQSTKLYFMK